MVLEWREREHEDMDQESLQDAPTVNVLREIRLLINYWDHDLGMFDLQGEFLEATSEDVYFIFGLSRWGASMNLEGTGRGGDLLSV